MTHKEILRNARTLAELGRIMPLYFNDLPNVEAEGQLRRYLPRMEEMANALAVAVEHLTAENRQLSERVRLFTEETNRRARATGGKAL